MPDSAIALSIVDDPLDTSNDTRGGAGAAGIENLDTNNVGGLGNTNRRTSNGASDVCPVSITLKRSSYLLAQVTSSELRCKVIYILRSSHATLLSPLIALYSVIARPPN